MNKNSYLTLDTKCQRRIIKTSESSSFCSACNFPVKPCRKYFKILLSLQCIVHEDFQGNISEPFSLESSSAELETESLAELCVIVKQHILDILSCKLGMSISWLPGTQKMKYKIPFQVFTSVNLVILINCVMILVITVSQIMKHFIVKS